MNSHTIGGGAPPVVDALRGWIRRRQVSHCNGYLPLWRVWSTRSQVIQFADCIFTFSFSYQLSPHCVNSCLENVHVNDVVTDWRMALPACHAFWSTVVIIMSINVSVVLLNTGRTLLLLLERPWVWCCSPISSSQAVTLCLWRTQRILWPQKSLDWTRAWPWCQVSCSPYEVRCFFKASLHDVV